MKYLPKFFKDTMPDWKRKKDPLIARFIHRPISFIFSSIFVEMGLTPNQVSFISLIIAIVSCVLFGIPNDVAFIIAFILLNLWSITDSADGNMARSLGGKPYGDFIDATSSYFLYGMMFLPLAYSATKLGYTVLPLDGSLIILIGGLTGSIDTMTRLFFQKMKNNTYEIKMEEIRSGNINVIEESSESQSRIRKIQAKIDGEFTSAGTVHLLVLLISFLTRSLDICIVLYFIYNGITFLASVVYLIKTTGCLRK